MSHQPETINLPLHSHSSRTNMSAGARDASVFAQLVHRTHASHISMGLMTNYSSLDTTGGSRRTDSLSGGRRSMRARRAKSILINWRAMLMNLCISILMRLTHITTACQARSSRRMMHCEPDICLSKRHSRE
jgi:hypothetical protein